MADRVQQFATNIVARFRQDLPKQLRDQQGRDRQKKNQGDNKKTNTYALTPEQHVKLTQTVERRRVAISAESPKHQAPAGSKPKRCAAITASVQLLTPSALKIAATWIFTVPSDKSNSRAIVLLILPYNNNLNTSNWQ